LRSRYFNVTSGAGYVDVNGKFRFTITPPFVPDVDVDEDLRHFNVYTYANINLIKNVTLSAGASFDYISGSATIVPGGHVGQFNPKLGITWRPFPGTSIRAAVTRSIKRTLITDQTLEPTQVAGFNQFFDGIDVTKSWRSGIAVDQRLSRDIFGGLEFSTRHLKIPTINPNVSPPTVERFAAKEYLSHAYLFWTPHPWMALRARYEFERVKDDPLLGEGGNLDTHRIPLGVGFYHPSGLSASLTATYYRQLGNLINFTSFSLEPVNDHFWIVDPAINYRLPKRYGFVTVGATNLLDKNFKYFDTDFNNARIQPKRTIFFKLTLALP
jgi:hypothetical protein